MKNLKLKKQRLFYKSIVAPVAMFLLVFGLLISGIRRFIEIGNKQELLLMQASLKKAVIQCYANEGFYPADLSYLIENYHLRINESKYNVYYDCFSSNVMPEFEIYAK